MKKKHRKIVVNGLPFAYMIGRWGDFCKVWLDKKPWAYIEGEQTWTPQRVKNFILEEIKKKNEGALK